MYFFVPKPLTLTFQGVQSTQGRTSFLLPIEQCTQCGHTEFELLKITFIQQNVGVEKAELHSLCILATVARTENINDIILYLAIFAQNKELLSIDTKDVTRMAILSIVIAASIIALASLPCTQLDEDFIQTSLVL